MKTYEDTRKFETGDLVTLTHPCMNIKRGTIGIVLDPVTQWKVLMTVHIDGGVWSFPEREFVHTRNYKEKK